MTYYYHKRTRRVSSHQTEHYLPIKNELYNIAIHEALQLNIPPSCIHYFQDNTLQINYGSTIIVTFTPTHIQYQSIKEHSIPYANYTTLADILLPKHPT